MKTITKKLRAFGYVYFKSLTSFSYYRDILKTNFKFSVKYFLFVALATTLIFTIKTAVTVVPGISAKMNGFMASTKNFYPDDLVFTIKNGEWSVNRPEPFIVALPQTDEVEQATETPKNIIVFYNTGTIEDLKTLDTMVLVNKVNVLYRDGEGIGGYPIKSLPDSRFDRTEFDEISTFFNLILRSLPVLFVLGTFVVVLLGNVVGRAFYFVWIGLLVWLASMISGQKLDYKNSVKIAVHSATLSITVEMLLELFNQTLPIMFWFSLTNLFFAVLVLVNMKKANNTTEQKPAE
jgi:hypothetical protein